VASFQHSNSAPLGVEAMRAGIQGRGVLLDLAWFRRRNRLDAGEAIEAADLELAAAHQGVEIREGDILLLRTGWMSVFTRDRDRERYLGAEPGLELGAAQWLHNRGIAFLAADNWGIEVTTGAGVAEKMPLRSVLIRDMGMPLGKMFDLERLAEHCRSGDVWDFQFTCLPLPFTGGIGSPVAPIASF
jgi:kynurenine formamidase